MKRNKIILISLPALLLGLAIALPVASAAARSLDSGKIPGKYIVVLKNNSSSSASREMIRKYSLQDTNEYSRVIKGFSASLSDAKLKSIKKDSRVAYVVQDRKITIAAKPSRPTPTPQPAQVMPTGFDRTGADAAIGKGAGVRVAVIDTGVDLTHPDLKTNLAPVSKNCVPFVRTANDDNGHGTHVAGTIAADNNTIGALGVAPDAQIVPVKVLDRYGSGSWSSVICGIDWVTANAAKYGIKVANMSLGGAGASDDNCGQTNNDPLHAAICRSVAAGVTYVVAAGNESANTAGSVPAAYDDAVITVSALADSDGVPGGLGAATSYGADDTFASFSNYGAAVDIAAPGVSIFSTYKGSTYATLSGTSMATPHVAGAAALYIAAHPGSTWRQVRDGLVAAAEADGAGHTGSALHPEPVLLVSSF